MGFNGKPQGHQPFWRSPTVGQIHISLDQQHRPHGRLQSFEGGLKVPVSLGTLEASESVYRGRTRNSVSRIRSLEFEGCLQPRYSWHLVQSDKPTHTEDGCEREFCFLVFPLFNDGQTLLRTSPDRWNQPPIPTNPNRWALSMACRFQQFGEVRIEGFVQKRVLGMWWTPFWRRPQRFASSESARAGQGK